jgi:hypothetical protein
METVLNLRIDDAMAGAMSLGLPVVELLTNDVFFTAVFKAAGIVVGALVVAAAVLFIRLDRRS